MPKIHSVLATEHCDSSDPMHSDTTELIQQLLDYNWSQATTLILQRV